MKHRKFYRNMLCLVLVILLAAAVLTLTGCSGKSGTASDGDQEHLTASSGDQTEVGSGKTTFYFEVTDKDGGTASYTVYTDAKTVGEALLENKLIDGTDSDYGLYVTTVDGQTLDWDADQMYWAFYDNGEYASAGVDQTEIVEGATYAFVATAG